MATNAKLAREMAKPEHVQRMKQVREAVERVCKQFAENTEAGVIAGALVQQAKIVLSAYPDRLREDLTRGAVAHLTSEDLEPKEPSPIWLPRDLKS